MKFIPSRLPEVLLIEPTAIIDDRGLFMETYNQRDFDAALGAEVRFVQDNHSTSMGGVLRGLHYQLQPRAQGKLVRVARGRVFDVAVDVRRSSPHFGQWVGIELSAENRRQVWIPAGFAHGFLVLSDVADFLYKVTDHYAPDCDRSLRWDDPSIGIKWPLGGNTPVCSAKDAAAPPLAGADCFP